jgi:hypothetical protein
LAPERRNAVSKFATVRFGVVPFAASAIPAEIFADSDFNLGERRIRDFRGRVVPDFDPSASVRVAFVVALKTILSSLGTLLRLLAFHVTV